MKELTIKGTQNFLGFNIPVIEGGFGENQKVILTKTVAEIHELEVKEINKLINSNIGEFEFGIDIIDLKTGDYKELVLENKLLTKAQWGNAKNIYLLSEQGYFALVSLMKTDKAKEIRKQLRREYFNMRKEIKDNPYKNLSKELQAIFIHDEKIQKIEEEIKHLQDDVPLYTSECEVLQNKLKAKIVKLLGGKSAPAYRNASLRKKAYVDIQNQIKREFNVYSYKSISRKYYQKALETIDNYIFPTVLNNEATKLNNQILMDIINKRY